MTSPIEQARLPPPSSILNQPGSKRSRFEALDGWRGIAALSVALYHLTAAGHFYSLRWIRSAGILVDLFFVLSGFVIYHSYFDKLSRGGTIRDFAIRRFGRLWPLHIFTLAILASLELVKLLLLRTGHVTAGEGAFTNQTSLYALVSNIFLLHSLGLHHFYSWNGPSWSISVEFWTYLIFAVIARFASSAIVGVSITLALTSALILRLAGNEAGDWFKWGLFRCLLCFFVGVLVYRIYQLKPKLLSNPAWEWVALGATIALAWAGQINMMLMKPLVYGFLVLVFAHQTGAVSRILLSEPIQKLGLYSYSIYLLHFAILSVLNSSVRVIQQKTGIHIHDVIFLNGRNMDMINIGDSPYANDALALIYLAIVCGCASLTYRYIEDPARRLFNGLAARSEHKAIAVSVPSRQASDPGSSPR